MSSIFKTFNSADIVSTRTMLYENIPITGSIISGSIYSQGNIKNFSHDYFQKVYDYPYLSSSANELFDISIGIYSGSSLNAGTTVGMTRKINMYNQMAQVLMGFDATGSVLRFDEDGDISGGGTKMNEVIFLSFARLLTKDEIKKGSVNINLGIGTTLASPFASTRLLTDSGSLNTFRVNSPAGEYAPLYSNGSIYGLVFYQAGVIALSSSVFPVASAFSSTQTRDQMLSGAFVSSTADAIRRRIDNIQFNNTTELNSSIYFVRLNNNEFNYSANPTYLSGSKIRVKRNASEEPVAYLTTIGMYSADNELLGVCKVSEPLKKTPSTEYTLRCRIDY